MNRWKTVVVGLLAVATLVWPRAAFGQTRAAMTGTVTDQSGGVLPGVTLTLTSPNQIGGAQTTVTSASGAYRFKELMPGVYALTSELQGFRTLKQEGLRVSFAGTLTVDVKLEVASVAETVTVSGAAPTVDVKNSSATTTIDTEMIQNIPTSRYISFDVVNITPGISATLAFGATSLRSINFVVDGVSTNGVGNGGTIGSYTSINWFEEVQVVGLGANAEYGEYTGAYANQIIRSGSNRFSGLAEYGNGKWTGDNRGSLSEAFKTKFTRSKVLRNWDVNGQVGGPIIKDKLFFFTGGYRLRNTTVPVGVTDPLIVYNQTVPRLVGKVNWAVAPGIRVESYVAYDTFAIKGYGASRFKKPEALQNSGGPQYKGSVRLTWTVKNNTLLEVANGTLRVGPLFYNPAGPGTEDGPAPHYEQLTGIISQNAPWVLTQRERRNTTKVTLTRFTEGFAGKSHELKFGVEYEGALGKSKQTYPAGMYFLDLNGAPDQVKLWAGDSLQANIHRTALYAQDVWSINDKLTLTPGVRFAMYRGSVPDSGTVYSANPVAPRLGLAWDVFSNHKTVARFHYGRYHEPLVTGMFNYMNIQGRTPRITAKVLAPGVFQETTRVTPKDNYGIDPNVTQPFVEEIVAGIEREVLPDTGIQVQYVHRGYKNILAFSDTGSVYQPAQGRDPGPDGVLATADDGQMITVYNLTNPGKAFLYLTNPDGAYRNYNGVMFALKKRFSHNWTLMADYTWSKTFGPVSNNESDNTAAGPDTGQSGIFVNPNKMINAVGNAEIDFTHQIKVNGMYHVPFLGGFNVGLRYQYLTGGAWGRTATIRGLTQGNETVRIEPRGTHRDPSYSVADLRVEKTLPLGSHRTAGVYVDAFNVTNKGVVNFIAGYGAGTIFQSGSTYGTPAMWIAPRTIRLGVRFTF